MGGRGTSLPTPTCCLLPGMGCMETALPWDPRRLPRLGTPQRNPIPSDARRDLCYGGSRAGRRWKLACALRSRALARQQRALRGQLCFSAHNLAGAGLSGELSRAWLLLVRGIITCKSGGLMSLMKSSEGKRFSGELRIFISHTRNLTCRLVGSGNLSHEIVLLRVAPSPAAFRNYLTHRLRLDRLPSVETHLLSTKSALLPLPTSLCSWCGSPAAPKGSPTSSREPRSPLPGARSPGQRSVAAAVLTALSPSKTGFARWSPRPLTKPLPSRRTGFPACGAF